MIRCTVGIAYSLARFEAPFFAADFLAAGFFAAGDFLAAELFLVADFAADLAGVFFFAALVLRAAGASSSAAAAFFAAGLRAGFVAAVSLSAIGSSALPSAVDSISTTSD